jgi:plasmid stabilization system protein ParE
MSDFAYQLSAEARLDVLQIWNYLAEHETLDLADSIIADIELAIHRIVATPGIGHIRSDLTKRDVLFYRIHSYLIIYRPKIDPLHIIRVLHSARDIKSVLKSSGRSSSD